LFRAIDMSANLVTT